GGEHERDVQSAEEIQVEQFAAAPRAVEERGRHAAAAQRLGERGEGGEADAAGNHPRLRRWFDDGERPAEGTETGHALSRSCVVDQDRGRADALAEQREGARGAVVVAKDLEN